MSLPDTWGIKKNSTKWNALTGWTRVQVWEGEATDSQLNSVLATLTGGATEVDIDKDVISQADDGTMTYGCTLTITWAALGTDGSLRTPGTTDYGLVSRLWTLHTNKLQRGIETAPAFLPLFNRYAFWPVLISKMAEAYRLALTQQYTEVVNGRSTTRITPPDPTLVPDGTGGLVPVPYATSDENALANKLFALLIKRPELSYENDQPVLRKTETVTSDSTVVASHTNVLRFYTSTALATAEPSLPYSTLVASSGLSSWYWWKQSPDVEQTSGGVFQVVQEYWGAKDWETDLYGAAIT